MPTPTSPVGRAVWRVGGPLGLTQQDSGERLVPTESPVALTYNRTTHAVMLATPADLEDFAVGFSISEGIISSVEELQALEVVAMPDGVECRMDLAEERLAALTRRQRHLAGPSGCGLCGLDSLAAAMRPAPVVPDGLMMMPADVRAAMQGLPAGQVLNVATRAVHAAAFWVPDRGIVALREDVGRHNALDKLGGALARKRMRAADGAVLLSSRVSVEMVQKTAVMGASILVAVSAPTSLAIRQAEAAGITLIGIARADGFEVFTRPDRIGLVRVPNVA